MTTNPYFLPSKLVVLIGPNKFKYSNSRGLEVDTKFFDLKDFFVCFSNCHALQILSSSKLIYGIPSTKSFLINLFIK